VARRINLPRPRWRGWRGKRGGADESAPQPPAPTAGAAAPSPPGPEPGSQPGPGAAPRASEPAAAAPEAAAGQPQAQPTEAAPPSHFESLLDDPRRPLAAAAAGLVAVAAGIGIGYALFSDGGDQRVQLPAVAPTVVLDELPEPDPVDEVGPRTVATQNTTRIAGVDPTADAAGVALASYPPAAEQGRARVAVLAPADSWQSALAAGSLAADPIGAPILLGASDEIPGFTAEALAALSPRGLKRIGGVNAVAIGDVATPEDLNTLDLPGGDPAEVAKQVDRLRRRLGGRAEPAHIVVASSERAPFAMPAAAWAARSGDPIVFADGDQVPNATIDVIEQYPDAGVYVLGPESVISKGALRELEKVAGRAIRVGAEDPVSNAIEFARFVDGDFGWNIIDPGHGFVIANTGRPADVAAAAPLAAGGKPGPLLLTDTADQMPDALGAFLLDTKPGFVDDPTRAVYNHAWLLGDSTAISPELQAEIDRLTELEQIARGAGNEILGGAGSAPEPEVSPKDR
jgi:hypothetical protein